MFVYPQTSSCVNNIYFYRAKSYDCHMHTLLLNTARLDCGADLDIQYENYASDDNNITRKMK